MSSSPQSRGLLLVVSAPSGTGKTTVVDRLVLALPGLQRSRSYTSRPPRPGERDGVDYNFVSRAEFEAMIHAGDLLEWAELFGNLYGTGRSATEAALAGGSDLVLVIDVQGARQVRRHLADTIGIFVLPPSFQALEHRLRTRSLDPEAAIARRLDTARLEVSAVSEYEYVVVNDDLDRCVREMGAIVVAERARLDRKQAVIAPIVRTFEQR